MELSRTELVSIFECVSKVDGNNLYEAAKLFISIVRDNPRLEPYAREVWEDKFKRQVPWSEDL